MKSPSILHRLRLTMFAFGIAMGIVFPIYAHFFVIWKPGMFPFFAAGAVMAGLTVGLFNYAMVTIFVIRLNWS